MYFPEAFGIVAALTSLFSTAAYVYAIWRHGTKPNRVTYWIWFALSLLILLSFRRSGGTTLWLQVAYVVNPLVIAIHSLWFGERHERLRPWVKWLNRFCLAVAAVSVPLWWALSLAFENVVAAALPILCLNLFADAMGALPTFEKAWNRPETEDRLAWLVCLLGATLNLGAVTKWTAADIAWNAWMWGASLLYVLLVYLRPPSAASLPKA